MNINVNINENRNVLQTRYPRPQQCPNNKVLYRVTFGYKSGLTRDHVFPVTYENFDDSFQKKTKILNPGDLVKYTPQNKKDPNYNRDAIIKKATNRYAKREAQTRGLDVNPDKDKNSFYDIEFINPIVGPNNQVIKIKNQISRLNKDGSVRLTKIQDEVESYVCDESFIPFRDIESYIQARAAYNAGRNAQTEAVLRGTENRLWNQHFQLDSNNQPQYPLMRALNNQIKNTLDREVENMVKVGFLLGKKEQRPEIKKSRNGFTLSFLMPKGASPGDTITIPVIKGKGKKTVMVEIVIQIPVTTGNDNHTPRQNEYITDVPINKDSNSGVYDNLKSMKSSKDVDTKFKPTYVKASEYVGPDNQKDLDMLVKPGSTQEYFINRAKIIPQDGNKFIFKKLTSFDKDSATLVFDLYVLVDLKLELKLKSPDDASDDTFGNKLSRTVTAGILNSSMNCPNYVERAKLGASQLLTKIVPRTSIARRIRRGLAARRQSTRERAADTMQRNFRRRQNIRSGRENVRRGGRRTRKKKKCIRRATKRLNKCWRKKKRKTFKKCWKKGRKKYKACKKKTKRRR